MNENQKKTGQKARKYETRKQHPQLPDERKDIEPTIKRKWKKKKKIVNSHHRHKGMSQ